MEKKSQDICLLTAEEKKESDKTALVPETIPALFLLSGILFAFQDMMYGDFCLLGAIITGCLVVLSLQLSELSPKISGFVKTGIYVIGILSFLGFIAYAAQGFLDTVNRFMVLWNLRFRTELEQFSVNSKAGMGSLLFWCLTSVLLASFLVALVKRRNTGLTQALVVGALLAGFVLGRSSMWLTVVCLLFGIFGMFLFSAAPGRQYGIGGVMCLLSMGGVFLVLLFVTGGYEGLSQIARWRAETVAWFEKFRYGEDTLPKGDLGKAQRLLEGEDETLRIDMEEPQEWYLKGFVGGVYDGTRWQELSMDAYQGEYEGLLQWLETKSFSPLTQFASYQKLAEKADESNLDHVRAEVVNTGAYRKFVYLPSSVESWAGGGSKEKRDWQVRSGKFFGAEEYEFQAISQAPSADEVLTGAWMQNPSAKDEETYLGAESVYRTFVEEYYMEVEDDLKRLIENLFFPEEREMNFHDVTVQIRRVLRQETRYRETPSAVPVGQDFTEWFLTDSKMGNAVHYASAAALAYRTAGYAARYVEGYHFAEEDAQKLLDEGTTVGVLTNKNAHAWVEVYVPGVGWLPVEVVPGMYTELYTNQVIEGVPAYQVNADRSEDGMEIEGGVSGEDEPDEESPTIPLSLRKILSILLFCLYVCFMLYLALEIQRVIRRKLQKKIGLESGDQAFIDQYVRTLHQLFLVGKLTGDYDHPTELCAQVEEKLAGVSREEYERVIQLIQKVRFGGKRLLPYEVHTLDCFVERLLQALAQRKGLWSKLKMRYWHALA